MTNPGLFAHPPLDPTTAPPGVNPYKASVARVYGALLGGRHFYPADAEAIKAATAANPAVADSARACREFLDFAVTELATAGHRQFLDVGSGLPTRRNIHEIAADAAPDARVVYVDNDPETVAHSVAIMPADDRHAYLLGDVAQPRAVLGAAVPLLDLGEPVVLVLACVLHFVPGEVGPLLDEWYELLPAGSVLVLVVLTGDEQMRRMIHDLYRVAPLSLRSPEEIAGWFGPGGSRWEPEGGGLMRVENFAADGGLRVEGVGRGRAPRAGEFPLGWLGAQIAHKP